MVSSGFPTVSLDLFWWVLSFPTVSLDLFWWVLESWPGGGGSSDGFLGALRGFFVWLSCASGIGGFTRVFPTSLSDNKTEVGIGTRKNSRKMLALQPMSGFFG